MSISKTVLKASPYYLEDVLGHTLDERAKRGKISFILLNQPPVCDSYCRRCFMPDSRRGLGCFDSLSLEESVQVLENAKSYGALCLEISGEGEPVLSKNLPGIIHAADSLGYLTTLITNGHNLDFGFIDLCAVSNVTLVFSHFSLDEARYESDNRLPGSFSCKQRNLRHACGVYRELAESTDCYDVRRLAIHATLQSDNLQDVMDLRKFSHNNGIFFSIAPLAQTGCALSNPGMMPGQLVSIAEELVPLEQVPLKLGDNSIIHSHSSKLEIGREVCGTCFYGLNIGYDGASLLDAHSGYELSGSLGNVRTTPFNELVGGNVASLWSCLEALMDSVPLGIPNGQFSSKNCCIQIQNIYKPIFHVLFF